MAQEVISVGTTPNDNTGDTLRDAFIKTNSNFTELYTDPVITGSMTVDNLRIDGNTLSSTNTNGDIVLDTNGTGAINLAPGTQGINVSNGSTVTAITRTSGGSNYTSPPTVTISAPTTDGGVQATATCLLWIGVAPTVVSGGTGYALNDVITLSGGTFTIVATALVTGVSGGVVTTLAIGNNGNYSVIPTGTISTTGGTGTGLTVSVSNWVVSSTGFTITNAGSGYVEQPTVTFSGGGGSGAAAFATVGSGTTIRSLGSSMSFFTPNGESLRVSDNTTAGNYVDIQGSGSAVGIFNWGTSANIPMQFRTRGTGNFTFSTGSSISNEQLRVSHTASAVNYVQVTGSATAPSAGNLGGIFFTGSDTNVNGAITSKGSGYISFAGNGSTNSQAFRVITTNAISTGNLIAVQGAAAGSAPSIQAISGASGTDANINLQLSPKGTGSVLIGTSTSNNIDKLQVNGSINASDVKIDGESINASIWSRSFLLMGS